MSSEIERIIKYDEARTLPRRARRLLRSGEGRVKIPGIKDKDHLCCWEWANPHTCASCCKCGRSPANKEVPGAAIDMTNENAESLSRIGSNRKVSHG